MLVAEAWVYHHMPKTGGTWVERACSRRGLAALHGYQHEPAWTDDAAGYRPGRLVWGTTRDPWSWYASLYCHAVELGGYGTKHPGVLAYGADGSFRAFLRGATHGAVVPDALVGAIWHGQRGAGDAFVRSGVGLWTWAHRYHYGSAAAWQSGADEWRADILVDCGQVREGLRDVAGIDADDAPEMARRGRPLLAPPRYDAMFTLDMLGWVADADAALIARLGMRPFVGTPTPAMPARVTVAA